MPKKGKTLRKTEDNETAYNRLLRLDLNCSICAPNKGENSKRKPKHGVKKPKKKDKRQ